MSNYRSQSASEKLAHKLPTRVNYDDDEEQNIRSQRPHRQSKRYERRRSRSLDRDYRVERKIERHSQSPEPDRPRDHQNRKRRRSRSRSTSSEGRRKHEFRQHDRRDRAQRQGDQRTDQQEGKDSERSRDRDHYRDHIREHGRKREKPRHRPRSRSPKPFKRSDAPLPSQKDAFTSTNSPSSALDKPVEKQKPNFGLTGKLAAASNTIQTANQTIVLKYHEPPEARKPPAKDQWRLYVFKGEEILDTVELSEQSCWLIGREVAIADLPVEHLSCSKQHAVIQFRYLERRNEFGDKIGKVKPYVIDLDSFNGTTLNEDRLPAAKYVELRDKDVLKFGHSSRDYVIQLPSVGSIGVK